MEVWTRFDDAESELDARISALASKSFDELNQLPPHSSAAASREVGVKYTVNRQRFVDGSIRIVVQAYRPGRKFLFVTFGEMIAKGFTASPDGSITHLAERELSDFM